MRILKNLLCLSVLLLAACGGDAGEGDSNGQSLTFTGVTSGPINSTISDDSWAFTTVSVAFTGATTQPVTVVIEDADQMFSYASVQSISNGVGVISLSYSNKLKAGTYLSNFKIHACAGSQIINSSTPAASCVGEYPGSPVTVQRNVVVQSLQFDKTSLNFFANGGTPAAVQTIAFSGGQGGASASFASTDSVNGKVGVMVNGKTITLFPLPGNIAGHYTGTLTVNATGFKPQQLKVNYDIASPEFAHGITLFPAYDNAARNKTVSSNSPLPQNIFLNWAMNNPLSKIQSITINYETGSAWVYSPAYTPGSTFVDLRLLTAKQATAGVYKANVVITTNTSGQIDTYTVPISLTVQ